MECPGRLKCLATEVFFLFLMSDLWLVNRFLQGILCHTNILYATLTAFNQIDYTLCLAIDRNGHCVGFTSGCAFERACFLDVITGLTFFSFAFLVPCEGESRLD